MAMIKLVDTSLCQGCRACQVSCKQWNQLPAITVEEGLNKGTYENPPSLSAKTWSMVKFHEFRKEPFGIDWVFFPDSCRHCPDPVCMQYCPVEGAITKDADTGAVVINPELCGDCCGECAVQCPYGIPKFETGPAVAGEEEAEDTDTEAAGEGEGEGEGGEAVTYRRAFKCRLCIDRLKGVDDKDGSNLGLEKNEPACAKVCPGGAISYVDEKEIKVPTYPGSGYATQWILTKPAEDLGLMPSATASNEVKTTDRRSALSSLIKPLGLGALAVGACAVGARGSKSDKDQEG